MREVICGVEVPTVCEFVGVSDTVEQEIIRATTHGEEPQFAVRELKTRWLNIAGDTLREEMLCAGYPDCFYELTLNHLRTNCMSQITGESYSAFLESCKSLIVELVDQIRELFLHVPAYRIMIAKMAGESYDWNEL